MKSLLYITIPASLLIIGGAIAIQFLKPSEVESNQPNLQQEARHPVTETMNVDAESRSGKMAPAIRLKDSYGKDQTLAGYVEKGPALVLMILDGCPCNLESQEYFNQIAKNYEGKATVIGVMNADQLVASKYRDDLKVPFPILSAPDDKVYRAYEAKQSVYAFLVSKDGEIKKVWPGYSAATLVETNEMLATEAGVPSKPLDVSRATKVITSGCYFYGSED